MKNGSTVKINLDDLRQNKNGIDTASSEKVEVRYCEQLDLDKFLRETREVIQFPFIL